MVVPLARAMLSPISVTGPDEADTLSVDRQKPTRLHEQAAGRAAHNASNAVDCAHAHARAAAHIQTARVVPPTHQRYLVGVVAEADRSGIHIQVGNRQRRHLRNARTAELIVDKA
jgi:hypothetical protein